MKNSIFLIIFTLFSFSQCQVKNGGAGGGDFGSIPSVDDVQTDIGDVLNGPVKECRTNGGIQTIPEPSRFPSFNPAQAARKILAAKYQTCRILDNVEGTRTFDDAQPDVLQSWKKENPPLYPTQSSKCIDSTQLPTKNVCKIAKKFCIPLRTTPLKYSQGWRQTTQKNQELRVLESATDCSSFISTSFKAAGLKMTPKSTDNDFTETTSSIGMQVNNGQSCFEKAIISRANPIQSGDILNTAGEHIVMIDEVGPNPFGADDIFNDLENNEISKADALNECKNLSTKDFNFSLIHSSSSPVGSSGIIRQRADKFSSGSGMAIVMKIARTYCLSVVNAIPNKNPAINANQMMSSNQYFLRHKGKKEPICQFSSVPKIQGEECINECFENYL